MPPSKRQIEAQKKGFPLTNIKSDYGESLEDILADMLTTGKIPPEERKPEARGLCANCEIYSHELWGFDLSGPHCRTCWHRENNRASKRYY